MKQLTNKQKQFLLSFFVNNKFAGWRNIAENIIEKGTVLTTCNHKDIWWGGIGNFIRSEESEEGVGLWRYTFNLDEFLSSEWFRECRANSVDALHEQDLELIERREAIREEIQELNKL